MRVWSEDARASTHLDMRGQCLGLPRLGTDSSLTGSECCLCLPSATLDLSKQFLTC